MIKISTRKKLLFPVLMATTAIAGISAAQAQIETVVVTAEKRSEDLQKVPLSINVIGDKQLQQLQVTHFDDYAKFLPSVDYQTAGPGFAQVYIRGVTSADNGNHSGPLPSVGIYLDEQPITTIGGALDIHVYDIARVEELSGPQGTLYGASSEAGTIRIITNKPDTSGFSAAYDVEANDTAHGSGGYVAEGFVNIPLADNAAVRLVAWDERDSGYIDNVMGTNAAAGIVNGIRTFPSASFRQGAPVFSDASAEAKNNINSVETVGGRLALKFDLDDNWTITPTLMGQRAASNGIFAYDSGMGFLKYSHARPEYSNDSWYQAALTIEGKIGNFDLTYAGAYMDRWLRTALDYSDYSYFYDDLYGSSGYYALDGAGNYIDPSQWILGRDGFNKMSHEVRIASPSDDRLRFVAGLFMQRQGHFIEQRYVVPNAVGFSVFDDPSVVVPFVPGWPNTVWITEQQRIDRDYAAFGEVTFDITPKLKITGGIRGYIANNEIFGFNGFSDRIANCIAGPVVKRAPCADINGHVYETGETHKINLTWQVDDDHMYYGTISTGFRPGGVNRTFGVAPYHADFLTNYELGWKTTLLDGSMHFNGSVFAEVWNGIQFSTVPPNNGGLTVIFNAGKAHVYGIETSVDWAVTDDFTLTGGGTYTDAELARDYCSASLTCAPPASVDAPKGMQLPVTPHFKGDLIGRYAFHLGDHDAHLQGALSYRGSAWSAFTLSDRASLGKMPAYTTFDLAAGVDFANFSLELGATNLFDAHGQNDRFMECAVCGSQVYITPITPREIFVRLGQNF